MKKFPLLLAFVACIAMAMACRHDTPPPSPQTAAPAAVEPARDVTPADRHDLAVDERAGGHTLARHVSRTDEQLRQRLKDEPGISAASTYADRETAERVVALALKKQAARVETWSARSGSRPNLTLNYRSQDAIGRTLERRGRATVPCYDALIVLRWKGSSFYVLTSYPEAKR